MGATFEVICRDIALEQIDFSSKHINQLRKTTWFRIQTQQSIVCAHTLIYNDFFKWYVVFLKFFIGHYDL